jgi:hypothetical protein
MSCCRGSPPEVQSSPVDHCFGLHALRLLPVTPLHSRSGRQSLCTLQMRAHWVPDPLLIEAQTDCSGQASVDPEVLQGVVQ